jgi:hypothetical protein
MENKKVIVYVDDNFHHMDESYRYRAGEYNTLEEAIEACKIITENSMDGVYLPNISVEELIRRYRFFGEDPWIYSEQKGIHFSAWTYVEREAENYIKRKMV